MTGESKFTTDHEKIREWVEARGGHPSTVAGTGNGDDPGVLRIDFPGFGDETSLEQISWERFFDKFEKEKLAFLYQEENVGGEESRFFKFIQR